jgi:hypothetical protein
MLYSAEKSWCGGQSMNGEEDDNEEEEADDDDDEDGENITGNKHTMTPKLKLSELARKTLLSCMRKPRFPGNWRTMMSTHMMDAPMTQAFRSAFS